MKTEDFKVKTHTGIRLWFHRRRERRHTERITRPAIVLCKLVGQR
jgi:hypothetical protein